MLVIIAATSYGFNYTIDFPQYLHASHTYTVHVKINSTGKFDVVILIPEDFHFEGQNIDVGELAYYFETKGYSYEGRDWIGLHWHVRKGGNVLINFTFTTPNADKVEKYEFIYTTESGDFGKKVQLIRVYTGEVPPPICGNGVCEPGENFFLCPADCGGMKSYVLDVLIILGVVLSSASVMIWYMKKKEFERSVMNMYNIDKLIFYIRSAMKANIPEWKIKENLYKMGWEPKVVEFIINKIKREKR